MERKTTLSVSSIALSDVSHDLFNFEMNFRSDEVITDDEAILYDIFVASLHPATTEKLKVFHCHTIIIKAKSESIGEWEIEEPKTAYFLEAYHPLSVR